MRSVFSVQFSEPIDLAALRPTSLARNLSRHPFCPDPIDFEHVGLFEALAQYSPNTPGSLVLTHICSNTRDGKARPIGYSYEVGCGEVLTVAPCIDDLKAHVPKPRDTRCGVLPPRVRRPDLEGQDTPCERLLPR